MADNRRDPTDMDQRGRREPVADKRAVSFRASIPAKQGAVSVHGNGTEGRVILEVERDAFGALAIIGEDYTDGTMFDVVITPLGMLDDDAEWAIGDLAEAHP